MSLKAFWSTVPLAHQLRTSASLRTNFQQVVQKNGFGKAPRTLSNQCTVGTQRLNFSLYSSTRSHRSSFSSTGAFYKLAGVAGLGLGVAISAVPGKTVYCERTLARTLGNECQFLSYYVMTFNSTTDTSTRTCYRRTPSSSATVTRKRI